MTIKNSFYAFTHIKKHIKVERSVCCPFLNVSVRIQACLFTLYVSEIDQLQNNRPFCHVY